MKFFTPFVVRTPEDWMTRPNLLEYYAGMITRGEFQHTSTITTKTREELTEIVSHWAFHEGIQRLLVEYDNTYAQATLIQFWVSPPGVLPVCAQDKREHYAFADNNRPVMALIDGKICLPPPPPTPPDPTLPETLRPYHFR